MKVLLFLIVSSLAMPIPAMALAFSPQEQEWIREHPVVEYAIDPYWPIEYSENGAHQGLTRDYIDHLQRVTGLRFVRVPSVDFNQTAQRLSSGELLLASAVSERLLTPAWRTQMLLSQPYFFAASVVVTRASGAILFNAERLAGKTVAVRGGGGYAAYLQHHHPGIHLLHVDDASAALAAVDEGRADAAVGLDTVLQPLVRRQYAGRLHLAGVLSDMPVVLTMGVSPHEPTLVSIIDKALGSLTSKATDDIYERWLTQTDFGAPSWRAIAHYYRIELSAAVLVLALLGWLVYRTSAAGRRARSSERRMGAFLAMMTHEIRTPMSALLATLELLARSRLNLPQREWVGLANSSVVNLVELLDDVLDISRLDARAMSLDRQPTDVPVLAQSVAAIHRLNAQSGGVLLSFASSGFDHRLVLVDRLRLRQVLSNLLSNAVKFTHRGEIGLSLELQGAPDAASGLMRIRVVDTGVGIAAAQQTQLFQAFAQGDSATAGRYGGSGLGLSICKQLVELMGGDISLASVPGEGTDIVCRLPVEWVVAIESGHNLQAVASTSAPGHARQLLVVEDHPLNRRVVAEQLQVLGHPHLLAVNAPQALQMLTEAGDIGLVLLDCQLPGMDGYELARRIRQLPAAVGLVPIIALSGASDEVHRQRCYASGMNDVLVKPLQLQQLDRVCRQFLGGWAAMTAHDSEAQSLRELFVATCLQDLQGLRKALQDADLPGSQAYAHRIHGASVLMGAHRLARTAGDLERQLSGGVEGEVRAAVVDRLYGELEQYMAADQA